MTMRSTKKSTHYGVWKRPLSILLTLFMLVGVLGTYPAAATDGENIVTYPVTGGNIYFDKKYGEVTDCDKSVTEAVIPEKIAGVTVKTLDYDAFQNCVNLTRVVLPDSITEIRINAFENCTSLTSINIPESVVTIYNAAFSGCTSLESIDLPNVNTIWGGTFKNCSSLTNVNMDNVVQIAGHAFDGCDSLKSITLPKSVEEIFYKSFDNFTGDIYYSGTKEEWESIKIYNVYTSAWIQNYRYGAHLVTGVTVHFEDGSVTRYNPFTDISLGNWYSPAVEYVYAYGFMNGMTKSTFEPEKTTTRAMLVTMLHRLEGEPESGAPDFADVDPAEWYGAAVAWAEENDIVGGYGDGKFGPEDYVTREQVATILYRYAEFKGYYIGENADLTSYADAEQVSDYAAEALTWANGAGIVNGKEDARLDPQGNATRAEIATMITRFCERYSETNLDW